ncbi:MAG TPA: hypothetical protein DCM05_12585 [Elusimicrobia bacterium]|nr:hypothetical protein [Elusimicrobiota bacterium]
MKRLLPLIPLFLLCACGDEPEKEAPAPESGGGASSTSSGGGGGEVSLAGEQEAPGDPYTNALEHIKKQDWDSARQELLKSLQFRQEPDKEKETLSQLRAVEQKLAAQPAVPASKLLSDKGFYDQRVSIRGRFTSGGEVGYATQYFWIDDVKRLQCRYAKMPLEDKKRILTLQGGEKLMVRGTLRSPWGSNPDPYLEAEYVRVEALK